MMPKLNLLPVPRMACSAAAVPAMVAARLSVVGVVFVAAGDPFEPDRVLLTRRSRHLKSHPYQVGLPGGFVEPSDSSLAQAFRRELQEELLLPEDAVVGLELLGFLPQVRSLAGLPVQPIVTVLRRPVDLTLFNPDEISEVYAVDWEHFTASRLKRFRFNILGSWRESPLFHTDACKVWGLTAKILESLSIG